MFKYLKNKWFWYRGWRSILNIRAIPYVIKEMIFILNKGYPYRAVYDNDGWFIETERAILQDILENRVGYPPQFDKYENPDKKWENVLKKLIELLNQMDENNSDYETMSLEEQKQMMEKAKKEFFGLYSTYFYSLWY